MPTEQKTRREAIQPSAPGGVADPSCRLDAGTPGVPSCASGPLDRLRFVARELRDLLRHGEEIL